MLKSAPAPIPAFPQWGKEKTARLGANDHD
jgi:hypothetical protein